jgi:hypothetical protein
VKDLVAQGFRLVLSGSGGVKPQTPIEVLEEIRRNPLHPPGEVSTIMKEMKSLRKKGWSRVAVISGHEPGASRRQRSSGSIGSHFALLCDCGGGDRSRRSDGDERDCLA